MQESPATIPVRAVLRPQMPELDTLRGVAVSLVVLFHAFGFTYGLKGLSGIPKVFVGFTMAGWVGVNLFFVLSGFLITGILLDTKDRRDFYKRFYSRRALRILPLYYAVLVLLFVLVRAGFITRHISWSFLGLSAIYLSNVTPLFGVPMQYGVLWSLSVEEHFYLMWPIAVRALSREKVIACAAIVVAICVALRILYYFIGWNINGYIWLSADGLAMGAGLAAIARKTDPRKAVRRCTLIAFICSAALLVCGAPFGIFSAAHFLGLTVRETAIDLFFLGVLGSALLAGTSRFRRFVNIRPFQFLGTISYGVYLTHMLVFEVVARVTLRHWPILQPSAGHFMLMVVQFCFAATLTIAVTYLSRWYFEEPFLRMKDRSFGKDASENPRVQMPETPTFEVFAS
jgi:peptidoglycan/LPS O-acetylase OafA/YrhL